MLSEKILRSAMASKLAYARTEAKLKSMPHTTQLHGTNIEKNQKKPFSDVWFIDDKQSGVHAYAWKNGSNSTIIAFKGSSNFSDVSNLLDIQQEEFRFKDRSLKIHRGVLKMFQSIEGVLNSQLLDSLSLQNKKYVTFCGHSLGGAIALLAAAYYGNVSNNNIGISCHTFGAPKVGDSEFIQWLNEGSTEIVNIVNEGDVVPCFPLCGYDNDESKTIKMNHGVVVKGFKPMKNIFKEHDLETYIETLREFSELEKAPKTKN